MKRFLLFALACTFSALSLHAQEIEVPETQLPLLTKRTATWCSKCGGYGWSLFRDLLADNESQALVIAAHYGGSQLENPASAALVDELGGFSQPIFYLNTDNLGVNSSNTDQVRQQVQQQVQQISEQAPQAQTGILAYPDVEAEELVIQTKTRFFQPSQENVRLAVYLIQPEVVASQTGQGSDAEHKNVLRMAVGGETFGELLGTAFASGDEEEREYRISYADLQAAGFEDLSGLGDGQILIGAVLWIGSAGNYAVLNANQVRETLISATRAPLALQQMQAYPTPAHEQLTVHVQLKHAWAGVRLQLTDGQGRVLRQLFQGNLPSGGQTFELQRGGLPAGQYYLQLTDGKQTATHPVIFR